MRSRSSRAVPAAVAAAALALGMPALQAQTPGQAAVGAPAAAIGVVHGNWRVLSHGARAASANQAEAVHGATLRYVCTKQRDGIGERLELQNPNIASLTEGSQYRVRFHFSGGGPAQTMNMVAMPELNAMRSTGNIGPIVAAMREGQAVALSQADEPPEDYPVSTEGFAEAMQEARDLCRVAPEIAPDGKGHRSR